MAGIRSSRATYAKWAVTIITGLVLGLLLYSNRRIFLAVREHLSTVHTHRVEAFCAFTGCHHAPAAHQPGPATYLHDDAPAPADSAAPPRSLEAHEDTLRVLSSRVCGSPAVDGYVHVKPPCLEASPTARWWAAFYAAGGEQGHLVVHMEEAADYDGLAVKWGLTNKVASAQECATQCLSHLPGTIPGPFSALPCNAFAYCPDPVCFEPDAHHHTQGDCWLKFTEGPAWPEVNMRGDLPADYRARHPNAPPRVQWVSGVLLPPGVPVGNGTFGPRWKW